MKTSTFALALTGLAALTASGCTIEPVNYASCVTIAGCNSRADGCYTVTLGTGESDSFCSNGCGSDAECPTGTNGSRGGCYDVMGSGAFICYERCTDNFDCAPGFACTATSDGGTICLPGAGGPPPPPNYDSCLTVADCNASADNCYTISVGGGSGNMCSNTCASDADCPLSFNGDSGACYDVMGSGVFLCYERCGFSSDCQSGFGCNTTFDPGTGVADAICLP
jgi:hypothetical protein